MLLCSRINRRLFGSNGAEVGEAGPGLVFVVGSSVVSRATWGFEVLGGEEPTGFLIVKRECSRKCCGRLAGGRLTGGCWNNLSLGWRSLVSWGSLGQIDPGPALILLLVDNCSGTSWRKDRAWPSVFLSPWLFPRPKGHAVPGRGCPVVPAQLLLEFPFSPLSFPPWPSTFHGILILMFML